MKFILIAVFLFDVTYSNRQSVPVNLGEFNTAKACDDAAKTVRQTLRPGASIFCLPKGQE